MTQDTLKKQIARLSRHAFTHFVKQLFDENASSQGFEELTEVDEDTFVQPYLDSYGGSIHRVFLLHTPPLELFHPSRELRIDDPTLTQRLAKTRNIYKDRLGQWGLVAPLLRKDDALQVVGFLLNICGVERVTYERMLIPAYQRLKRWCGLKHPSVIVGSPDSFVEKTPEAAARALERTLNFYKTGIAITLSDSSAEVHDFEGERWLHGALRDSFCPYEPVVIGEAIRKRAILHDFERLLQAEPSEAQLEGFLLAYYQDIFGTRYDRIETQVWLRFPDADVAGRDRRLDMFLRNSVTNDWELLEIKRPVMLSCSVRDVPSLRSEVHHAIQQVRNYARILQQDRVKRHFASQGIEYYEPRLSLVIGRSPELPHEQWRWLCSQHEGSVNIITYDEILRELRARLVDRYAFLERLRL